MSEVLNVAAEDWAGLTLRHDPYPLAIIPPGHLIGSADAVALARTFPTEGMVRYDSSFRTTSKRYRNFSLPVPEDLSEYAFPDIWCRLFNGLRAPGYRKRMAQFLGQKPARQLELRLVRHGVEDWLSPHTDNPDKLFTHVFYFNMHWQESNGGWFEALYAPDPDAVALRVLPRLGTSIVLCPSDTSWHQVRPVTGTAQTFRHSLVVHAKP
jgi:hypothetical protein